MFALAIAGLSIDAQALTDFTTAADQGGTAMTESVTNLLPAYVALGVVGLIVTLIFAALKMPTRLTRRKV